MDAKKDAINKIANKLENIDDAQIIVVIKNYTNIKDYQNELNLNSNIEFYSEDYSTKVNLQKVEDNIFIRYENINHITIGPFNLTSTSDYTLNKKINTVFETLLNKAKELYEEIQIEKLHNISEWL